MLIIVTDEGRIWNHKNPALEPFADCVLVVCLNGEKVTDKYQCFVSPYHKDHMIVGQVDNCDTGEKFQALESVRHQLRYTHGYHEDILFLTDNTPQSMFPYLVLKDIEEFNRLHLWCMTPWDFEGRDAKERHVQFFQGLSSLKSLLLLDSDTLKKLPRKGNRLSDIIEAGESLCKELLPTVVCDIGTQMGYRSNYYFDLQARRYIEVDNSFEEIMTTGPLTTEEIEAYRPFLECCTLGLLGYNDYPNSDEHTKNAVEKLYPRFNGKQICEQLKQMRRQLVEANGINYIIADCPSTGPCAGTCPQCDKEITDIQHLLLHIPENERIYPATEISTINVRPIPKASDEDDFDITMGILPIYPRK